MFPLSKKIHRKPFHLPSFILAPFLTPFPFFPPNPPSPPPPPALHLLSFILASFLPLPLLPFPLLPLLPLPPLPLSLSPSFILLLAENRKERVEGGGDRKLKQMPGKSAKNWFGRDSKGFLYQLQWESSEKNMLGDRTGTGRRVGRRGWYRKLKQINRKNWMLSKNFFWEKYVREYKGEQGGKFRWEGKNNKN